MAHGVRRTMILAAGWLCAAALAGPAGAADWPQFHGPRRDNMSAETHLLKQWPEGGPKLLWTASGLGEGFSTVAVVGDASGAAERGRIYTTGNVGPHTVITCLDLAGKAVWRARNGPAYRRSHPGTRSTPTIEAGRLYHENADGDVVCLDARTGKPVWSLNILKKFGGRNIEWGLAESLLIDGGKVICTPGGEQAGLVALDKQTGRTVWVCEDTRDKPGYCSPTIIRHGGLRQIVTMMARSIVGVHPETGKLLWRFAHTAPFDENITTPIHHDGRIFMSSRTTGSRLVRLTVAGERVTAEQVWFSKAMDNQHGGVILLDGCLYGDCLRGRGGPWACLDFATGKTLYAGRGIGRASLTYADGLLYLLNHRGTVALVKPTPRAFEAVSRFQIPRGGRGPSWAHPVVCGGRLYIRHGDFLYCYDIKQPGAADG